MLIHIRHQRAALFVPPEGAGPYSNVALQRFFAATNQAHVATALSKMHERELHVDTVTACEQYYPRQNLKQAQSH